MWKPTAGGHLKCGGDRERIFGAFKVFELVGGGSCSGTCSVLLLLSHM